ncbi:uncharacterized protein LOC126660152 [Mercurialis annua]|uniref:uncharacterized protein LOC126660152 n=1 Tax=Mercurialis annua TaxID=3986 RepID=UPI0024AED3C2|nr:uncharacterized protein LOC126660152 [Mercurialis annua]
MFYLIHVKGLAEYFKSSLKSEVELLFVDLEQDPPKTVTQAEQSLLATELIGAQKLFSLSFPANDMNNDVPSCQLKDSVPNAAESTAYAGSSVHKLITYQSSDFIDLSIRMKDTNVTVPILNG